MKLLFRWINKLLCGWNVGLYFRPRIRYEGKKCLPAFTRGPAIIITNHKNQMDFLLVLYLFYFRYVRCLVGKTFYECNRFLNWCLRMLGAIKVDRFSFGMDFFCVPIHAPYKQAVRAVVVVTGVFVKIGSCHLIHIVFLVHHVFLL